MWFAESANPVSLVRSLLELLLNSRKVQCVFIA